MTTADAAKILSIIRWSYPNSYKQITPDDAEAMCRLWADAFQDVPYPIIFHALRQHIKYCKYPPTIAEITQILRHLHSQATETYQMLCQMCTAEELVAYRQLIAITASYAADPQSERYLRIPYNDLLRLTDGTATDVRFPVSSPTPTVTPSPQKPQP